MLNKFWYSHLAHFVQKQYWLIMFFHWIQREFCHGRIAHLVAVHAIFVTVVRTRCQCIIEFRELCCACCMWMSLFNTFLRQPKLFVQLSIFNAQFFQLLRLSVRCLRRSSYHNFFFPPGIIQWNNFLRIVSRQIATETDL